MAISNKQKAVSLLKSLEKGVSEMSIRPNIVRLIPVILALAVLLVPLPAAAAAQFGTVQNFGPSLKSDCFQPEGIAVDPETGRVYTTSAPFSPGGLGTSATVNICVLSPTGQLVDKISVKAGPSGAIILLGAMFVPEEGLYVLDGGNGSLNPAATGGRLLKIDVDSHAVTTVATGFSSPNDVTRDEDGNLYVSDSARGVIYRVNPGGIVSVWSNDPLLAQHGFIGVNDLAFDPGQNFLYTDNSDNQQLLRIPLRKDGSAGAAQIFATNSPIHPPQGVPDGIKFDVKGNLYVCTPALNQVQVISHTGQLVASLSGTGDNALDSPASLAFKGRTLYISDFSFLDGGVNSKVSRVRVPFPGLPLTG
jgi:sugar lactone lactonase YvrE